MEEEEHAEKIRSIWLVPPTNQTCAVLSEPEEVKAKSSLVICRREEKNPVALKNDREKVPFLTSIPSRK